MNVSAGTARLYLDTFTAVISEELQKGNDVSLEEFGDFYLEVENVISCKAGRNPISMRNAVRKVAFSPSRRLQNFVNRW